METYPFNHVQRSDVARFADTIEEMYIMKEKIAYEGEDSSVLQIVLIAMRFLIDNCRFPMAGKLFVDLMSNNPCEACLYASCFPFSELMSVELSDEHACRARILVKSVLGEHRRQTVNICVGSLKDYFPLEGHCVYYLDCSRVLSTGMADEGTIICLFFSLMMNVLPGTYGILVSSQPNFVNPRDDYSVDYLVPVFSDRVAEDKGSAKIVVIFKRV
jgi:hypothetical protein